MQDESLLPVLDARAAKALMRHIYDTETLDVAVFVDQGWGNLPIQISIIKDGNGQGPVAFITPAAYEELLRAQVIDTNNLRTFKSRKNHQYVGHGWLKTCRVSMQGASMEYPLLSAAQKATVKRAVQRFAKKGTARHWRARVDGCVVYYEADYPATGLTIEFGSYGGRFVGGIYKLGEPRPE